MFSVPSSNTERPTVSVIVPVFNGERVIAHCLRSLTAQTLHSLEIIVVYKPGEDDTLRQIRSVDDPRIHIIIQKDNTGPGGARNMGIRAAVGRYIGFAEADDFVDLDFYESLYRNLETHKADIAFGGSLCHERPLVIHESERVLHGFTKIISNLINGATFDKLFNASLIKENNIRFSEGLRWEDNLFIVMAARFSCGIITVPQTFSHYLPEQKTEEYWRRLERDASSTLHEIADFAQESGMSEAEKMTLRAFVYRSFAGSVWGSSFVYQAMKQRFGVSLPMTLRHYRKNMERRWREARNAVHKGVYHD